ncbi:FKBP-type peptidyl-prolyl cis-trans isomerase [Glaciecola sp. KUL10]|uniref:FKBP-type peptidyl-prolyl cis-trans isomerase n=1 Tax=Glaciecola sp. (strain KUL10) TaxID=2161813 RepID=UPI000D783341|nr:FKBP-type peptidyl-prolyl cis-trans isomerase [Glaciecola sp. KUL10]GBL04368.1 peptidylprolyl isomerase, FKBP-type [Glaciecola sp. KUL10]
MKKATLALAILSALALSACQKQDAQQAETAETAASTEQTSKEDPYTTDAQKHSYALGASMGLFAQNRIEQQNTFEVETDLEALMQGFKDGLEKETIYNMQEIQQLTQASDAVLREKMAAKEEASKVKNLEEGQTYLAENGKREGVTTTESGLQYEVLIEGEGERPAATDTVKVHYRGTVIDGTEFDSSYSRGTPAEFPLNGVISGWTEGVQLMTEGSKYRFHIPANLAYGERQQGPIIGPNSTLIFDVELLEIVSK